MLSHEGGNGTVSVESQSIDLDLEDLDLGKLRAVQGGMATLGRSELSISEGVHTEAGQPFGNGDEEGLLPCTGVN